MNNKEHVDYTLSTQGQKKFFKINYIIKVFGKLWDKYEITTNQMKVESMNAILQIRLHIRHNDTTGLVRQLKSDKIIVNYFKTASEMSIFPQIFNLLSHKIKNTP